MVSLLSILESNPTNFDTDDDIQLIGLRIKASDQLNGILDDFSVLVEPKIPVYDNPGTQDWTDKSTWNVTTTRNPAWIYVDVLTGQGNARAVSTSDLDETEIVAWANECDTEGWTYDSPGDFETTVYELAKSVAAAGRASWTVIDGKYSVPRGAGDMPRMRGVEAD